MSEPPNQKERSKVPGFAVDIRNFLERFHELNTALFEDFKLLWKEKKFSLIFVGKPYETDASNYVLDLFRCTSEFFLLESSTLQMKVGALFMQFCLYHLQPCVPKVSWPIDSELWTCLKEFYEDVLAQKLLDVYKIWWRLHTDKCYHFTAFARVSCYWRPITRNIRSSVNSKSLAALEAALSEYDPSTVKNVVDLNQIETMSAVYKFLKAQALGVHVDEDPTAPIEFPPSLRLVSSDMTENIRPLLEKPEEGDQQASSD